MLDPSKRIASELAGCDNDGAADRCTEEARLGLLAQRTFEVGKDTFAVFPDRAPLRAETWSCRFGEAIGGTLGVVAS